ncbi:ThiF family adenylyltransferase [Nocardioides szechwanensis]|uniref:ThiF family adenylyltransferase n=1 Tax=Nocardioides szechwanensis TaxID=1005944 RepID=UPI00115FC8E6|nr:ThiF family adenylyltransferase [Nocardioides szechwanensis]
MRHVILAEEGVDYVPGTTGYRALSADFVRDCAMLAAAQGLIYVAVHNHGGWDKVGFSRIDMASHERGYPTLVQLTGRPVVGLVLSRTAAAGDIWLPDGTRTHLSELVVPGRNLVRLRSTPTTPVDPEDGGRWDRQARVYGDLGQAVLSQMRVAIVGLGGAGSIVCELLARLGVGQLVLIDSQTATLDNLPRLVAAEPDDIGLHKTALGARNARRAHPDITITELRHDVQDPRCIEALGGCDFIFLAADSNAARHLVNQTIETLLIPGFQVGVKVPVTKDGTVGRIHAAVRPLVPGQGCLWCNQLINPTELAIEMSPTAVREAARYVDDVPAASVIALNAVAVVDAVNQFMMSTTGLLEDDGNLVPYTITFPRESRVEYHSPRRDPECPRCGDIRCP